MKLVLMLLALMSGLQQGPPRIDKLPSSNRVTDKARPDFGYTPWAGSLVTVIVVYSADCAPCDASIPFYKQLILVPGMERKESRFVVLTEGGIAPVAQKIGGHPQGFKPDAMASYPEDDRFGIRQFPTLLILDGTWKKRGEWIGVMSAAQQAAARDLVQSILHESKGASR